MAFLAQMTAFLKITVLGIHGSIRTFKILESSKCTKGSSMAQKYCFYATAANPLFSTFIFKSMWQKAKSGTEQTWRIGVAYF